MPEVIIEKGQALTPDKKNILIQQMKDELSNVSAALEGNNNYGAAILGVIQSKSKLIQQKLNDLLLKKGIVTPDETTATIELLNESKKARLQEDYIMGVKKATFYLVSFAVIAIGAFFIVKNSKK